MMERFLRPEIAALRPYESVVVPGNVKMDANENPFPWPRGMKEELLAEVVEWNRYPDGTAAELRERIAAYAGTERENILVGNGSDELIQILLHTFAGPGKTMLIHPPTFSMYAAAARITGTRVAEVPLLGGSRLDLPQMLKACAADSSIKLIIVCNPNNPTGAQFAREDVLELLKETDALVLVDEAYAEFSGESMLPLIDTYPKLLVMRTFSKAFGMAALRLGYLAANQELTGYLNRVRQPFNVNSFSQKAGIIALKYLDEYQDQVEIIKNEVKLLYNGLREIPRFSVLPTRANFVLVQTEEAPVIVGKLGQAGYSVRNLGRLPGLGACFRLSPALPQENEQFLRTIKQLTGTNL
ncbi:histidinol phosphate aminotransferase apoenzyme [Syntrophobotulus glycolicus DSM 8271]|uniref:Histidinol-phosphate aminotransferase n=1 Tax=Syntrophobotulus glycolicus (strain DSM 8271 / FlGlyR) TaxID=645991 RepID=F0T0K9_SYNGF|nr:histidinol-phosphate transaminase [Syntrophobotulus glycolicus]ADY55074.1 histidinol phosphate aminotransferase apoenzyme [Syntrophobotulus glycolicus DSM 8271]